MPPITVHDVVRLALPPGTTVVAGAAGLLHQVTWVATPRATLPAFVNLRGGELALVSVAAIQALDERLTLASLVERLAPVPISAIAALGEVSDAARTAADAARMPLLSLPDGADLREVEREIQRLIGDYEAQLERRAAQLGNLLTQRSLAGAGLQGLLDTLAERTGQGVACYSVDRRATRDEGARLGPRGLADAAADHARRDVASGPVDLDSAAGGRRRAAGLSGAGGREAGRLGSPGRAAGRRRAGAGAGQRAGGDRGRRSPARRFRADGAGRPARR